MPRLPNALHAWPSDRFAQALKSDIEELPSGSLPLVGYVDDSNITATISKVTDNETTILANVGVFYNEIIAGCSCGDDPILQNTYCEMQVSIDKATAEATFSITGK